MGESSYLPPSSMPATTGLPNRDWMAYTSLGLGIVNLCAWFLPICGGPLTIVGLVLGALGLRSTKRTLAIVGLVLCGITLCLTIGNAVWGAYYARNIDWTQFFPQQ